MASMQLTGPLYEAPAPTLQLTGSYGAHLRPRPPHWKAPAPARAPANEKGLPKEPLDAHPEIGGQYGGVP